MIALVSFIISCLSLLQLVSALAVPILPRQTTNNPPSSPNEFFLKTSLVSGDSSKDGLYVAAYHTGAGENDAVLVPGTADASAAFLNGTNLQFDLGTDFPWGTVMGGDANYAGWEFVQINGGQGTQGFSSNSTGVQWESAAGFGGWLACDWWHGLPQLFWIDAYYNDTIPSSCSVVDLCPEAVNSTAATPTPTPASS